MKHVELQLVWRVAKDGHTPLEFVGEFVSCRNGREKTFMAYVCKSNRHKDRYNVYTLNNGHIERVTYISGKEIVFPDKEN